MKRILIGVFAGLLAGAVAAIAADNFNVLDKLNISFSTATITGQLAPANGGSGVANSKNLTWSNSLTLAGTDATTMTFPSTSASLARLDNPSFTGTNQIMQVGGTDGTNGAYILFQDTANAASRGFIGWGGTTGGSGITDFVVRSQGDLVFYENGSQRMRLASTLASSLLPLLISSGTTANQLRTAQTTVPTCTTNCGTGSPTVLGTDTAGIITLGTTPASAFQVNFNGTWPTQGPACSVTPALATMVVGKLPIAVVTTQTTMTVTTNGVAPATGDKYQYICVGVS